MKRLLTTLLLTIATSGPFAARMAAQTNQAKAEIPFAFVASNRTLPAGTYTFAQLGASVPVFTLRNTKGHGLLVHLGTNETGKPQDPSLTFACYGKECILARITPPNSEVAYGLSKSSIEKNLPHKMGMASMISIKLKAR
jgi:hypothetical protein